MTSEIRFEMTSSESLEPLDDGTPGIKLTGLRDVSGTFEGSLTDAGTMFAGLNDGTPLTLYLYGPDPNLPWWRHWWYKVREWVAYIPYPTVVLASGPATMQLEEEYEDGNDIVVTGTFTKAGKWTFNDDEEVNQ